MVVMWLIVLILCLLIASGSALLALRIQYTVIEQRYQEREAWQQAQEGRQRTWEVRQGKHILEAEKKLVNQLKDVRRDWSDWKVQVEQDQQVMEEQMKREEELARLPSVEDLELPLNASGLRKQPEHWRPPTLYGVDLRGRDLSHRYLGRADLREALLNNANFYMADLAGASLTGASLIGANLIGANLRDVDLRGANLTGANFLVADLHNAILHGACLRQVQNLSPEQLQAALYDGSTLIDSSIATTPTSSLDIQALIAAQTLSSTFDDDHERDQDQALPTSQIHESESMVDLSALTDSDTEKSPIVRPTEPPATDKLSSCEMTTAAETLAETSAPTSQMPAEIPHTDNPAENKIIQLQAHVNKTNPSADSEDTQSTSRSSNGRKRQGNASHNSHAPLDYRKGKHQQRARAN